MGAYLRRNRSAYLVLALAVAVLVAHSLRYGDWIVDDAAISYTYADNLARHGELSLFPGGERTEGYSNPTWVLLLALLSKLGLFSPVVTPKILGLALHAGSLALLLALGRRLAPALGIWLWLLPLLLLATRTSFVLWGVSGLENSLFVAVILAAYLRLLVEESRRRGGLGSGFLCFLVSVTRPEGAAYGLVIWGMLVARSLTAARSRSAALGPRRSQLLRFSLGFGLPLLAFLTWRWAYFHDWLPNPYYAKLRPELTAGHVLQTVVQGGKYLIKAFLAQSWYLLAPVALLSLRDLRRFPVTVLWMLMLVSGTFVVGVGGDWMMDSRLLSPVFPLFLLASMVGWASLLAMRGLRARPTVNIALTALFLVIIVGGGVQGWQRYLNNRASWTVSPQRPTEVAQAVRQWATALGLRHATFMTPDIGGSSYFGARNGLEVLDLGGLANRFAGRLGYGESFREYVLALQRPDFLSMHQAWSALADLQRFPRFGELYQPIWAYREEFLDREFPDRPYLQSGVYVRRDLVVVPAEVMARPVTGPVIGPLRFRGWSGPSAGADGCGQVTVYWEILEAALFPTFSLEWRATGGEFSGTRSTELAGGCYTVKFARPGDIVPSTLLLDASCRPGRALDLDLVVAAGDDQQRIPLGRDVVVVAAGLDVDETLARCRALLDSEDLRACLALVVSARDNVIPALLPPFRRLQQDLAQAFLERARAQEKAADFPGRSAAIWQDYWCAWRAWRGCSTALAKCIDDWHLRAAASSPCDTGL
jgi:hypothetical protein